MSTTFDDPNCDHEPFSPTSSMLNLGEQPDGSEKFECRECHEIIYVGVLDTERE